MTTVVVSSGACGFTVTIKASKGKGRTIEVVLETACEMVQKMQGDVASLDRMAALVSFDKNAVYRSAAKHLRHAACPVPSAILKAIETEAGMNVPRDATILFKKEP